MAKKGFCVVEWEIENFSCWNREIHGEVIECGIVRLYPRQRGEYLEVRIMECWEKTYFTTLPSALTVIASDGSIICTLSDGRNLNGFWVYSSGPRFTEIAARIKEKEHLHKDRLILRWQASRNARKKYIFYRSIIRFFDTSVEIDSKFFDDLQTEDWQVISVIKTLSDFDCTVSACKSNTKIPKFKIKLEATSDVRKLLVQTTFSISKAESITKIFKDNFLVKEERTFSFLQPVKDDDEKIFLTFKIITGRSENFFHFSDFPRTAEITNPSFSKSPENDVSVNPNALVSNQGENAVTVLTKELKCLYQDHDFSDSQLRCGTVSFPTHRGILCARSPVLKAMLSGDMREAASGHVDVEDLDPHTLGRFLAFLYSGSTGGEALGWEEAIKLYYAADKYQVPSLKSECLSVLCANVSRENVCDILSLADRHQDEKLTSVAQDFVSANFNEVLGSEKWEKFMSSDPLLVAKTVTHFAKSNFTLKKM